MSPFGNEQDVAHRVSKVIDEHAPEISDDLNLLPTAGEVFFEFGLMLAACIALTVTVRLLLCPASALLRQTG